MTTKNVKKKTLDAGDAVKKTSEARLTSVGQINL